MDAVKKSRLTFDAFFNGRIRVAQDRSGYRFSIDAVLLAHHAAPRNNDRILDLGTGCGIIPLILVFRHPGLRAYGVEIQESLAKNARDNVKKNDMEGRIQIFCMDMRLLNTGITGGAVDLVVTNPPYRKARTGRVNLDNQRAIARHEIAVTLQEVVDTGQRMLRPKGRFVTVVPAERVTDILFLMGTRGLEPKRLRMVHSRIDTEAKLAIVEGVKGARKGVKVESPLILYHSDSTYTEAVSKMFEA